MSSGSGRRADWLVIAALVLLASATLFPTGDDVRSGPWCVLCGARGLSDALLNVLLYSVLGAAFALRGTRATRAVAAGFAWSLACELLQLAIPGRDPTVGDVLFNTIGAGFGWLIVAHRAALLRPSKYSARMLAIAYLLVTFALLSIAAFLSQPAFSHRLYYGQWTPEFANLEHYGGRVVDVRLADIRIRSALIRRSEEARTMLLAGYPLRIVAVAGQAPVRLAPIFNIYDDRQIEMLFLGADGADVIVRLRARSAFVKLDQPFVRVTGALSDVAPGDTLRFVLKRVTGGICLTVNSLRACPAGFAVADSWKLLFAAEPSSPVASRSLDLIWLALLFAPAGFLLFAVRDLIISALISTAAINAISQAGHALPVAPLDVFAVWGGLSIGWILRQVIQTREKTESRLEMQRSMRV